MMAPFPLTKANRVRLASGRVVVEQSLAAERIARVSLDEAGQVLGWAASSTDYNGNTWRFIRSP